MPMTRYFHYTTVLLSFFIGATICRADDLQSILRSQDNLRAQYKEAPVDCKDPEDSPQGPWDIGMALGYNLTQGNVNSTLLTGRFYADYEKDKNTWFLGALGAVGEQDDETTQEFGRSDIEYNRLLSEKLYSGLGSTVITDQVAEIKYRAFVNPLIGYYLLKSKTWKFNVEVGPSWVFQRQGTLTDNFLAPRYAHSLKWKFSETASLFHKSEVLVSAENSEKILYNGEIGIETSLTKTLALVLSLQDRFDNQPATNAERNDILFTTSIKASL
jgi:putative salt-induced outer membrane protein YdiY